MNNIKGVKVGTKQEALITPKPGYEVAEVKVVLTADNQVVPSELKQISDNPAQWACYFEQPAGHVSIKPVINPILYSVTIEENDMCNIVMVEQNSDVDVEIKSAADANNEDEKKVAEGSSDFNVPQRSVNEDAKMALDVGENENNSAESNDEDGGVEVIVPKPEDVSENLSSTEDSPEVDEHEAETDKIIEEEVKTSEDDESDEDEDKEGENDVYYDAGRFEEELADIEPIYITQKEHDDNIDLYWKWKDKYDAGKCSEEDFVKIRTKYDKFQQDIAEGLIIIRE